MPSDLVKMLYDKNYKSAKLRNNLSVITKFLAIFYAKRRYEQKFSPLFQYSV